MIDPRNRSRDDNIITIEGPDRVRARAQALPEIHQREVGVQPRAQAALGLRCARIRASCSSRVRDLETVSSPWKTAETGHLVFGTLHTNTAPSTVDRIIDQFPPTVSRRSA